MSPCCSSVSGGYWLEFGGDVAGPTALEAGASALGTRAAGRWLAAKVSPPSTIANRASAA
jgi:hypothetical protein